MGKSVKLRPVLPRPPFIELQMKMWEQATREHRGNKASMLWWWIGEWGGTKRVDQMV